MYSRQIRPPWPSLLLALALRLPFAVPASGQSPATEPPAELEIRSTPSEAAVYLNYRLMGSTPLKITGLEPGRYRLGLELEGYYPHAAWVDYAGGAQVYETTLLPITGFLQVQVVPGEATVTAGSQELAPGVTAELRVGRYVVRARRFGYEEATAAVEIRERRLTTLELDLKKAPFRLSALEVSRRAFNPRNAAALGRVTVSFEVTAPGSGEALILDRQSRQVYRRTFPSFETWKQSFTWDGGDPRGGPLPDGDYRVVVHALPADGGEPQTAEAAVALDSRLVIRSRSLWSGASGLLFAPSPEILPPGSVQISTLAAVQDAGTSNPASFLAPWNLGARVGLRGGWELDALVGLTLGAAQGDTPETGSPPFFAGAAVKVPVFRIGGAAGTGPRLDSALVLKGAYQNSPADAFTNFTGLSAGLPLRLAAGRFSLLLEPEAILSPWRVEDAPGGAVSGALGVWLYGRAGLLIELGDLWIGLSAAARSAPLDQGFLPDPPVAAGLEAHWMVPGTLLTVSGMLTGQFSSPSRYTLQAGVGLGLLF